MGDSAEYRGERISDRVQERDDDRPLSDRDFARALAIIQAAGDEITTFREASLAFKGVREQLSIMTRVFATSVVIAIGCFGYLFITTTETSEAVAHIEERFGARFDAVEKRLDALTAAVERLQPPQKQSSLE